MIISNVIANHGCPCPGIGDVALGLSDTILHFAYNLLAYAGVAYAYVCVLRHRGAGVTRTACLPCSMIVMVDSTPKKHARTPARRSGSRGS